MFVGILSGSIDSGSPRVVRFPLEGPMFNDLGKEDNVFLDARFVPHGGKPLVFKDVNIIVNNEMTGYGEVGDHKDVVGIAIRINGARHGAVPDLAVGTEGTLTGHRGTDRVRKDGNALWLEETITSAIVHRCNPQEGYLVLIAASYDHITSPHAYSAM